MMKNPRLRGVLIAGVSLVAIGGLATVWATSSTAVSGRYLTTAATTGDVAESFLATGTVSRNNVVDAKFTGVGTVKQVKVAVGDAVAQGQVLASLDTVALKLALLNAETDLAQAKASLYAAQHPSSSGGGGRIPDLSALTGASGGSAGGISATDAAKLNRAIAQVLVASAKWSDPKQPTTCDRVFTALTQANAGSDKGKDASTVPSASTPPSASPSPIGPTSPSPATSVSPSTSPSPEPSPTPSTSPSSSAEPSPSTDPSPSTSPSGQATDAKPLALVVDDITVADILACGTAKTELLQANAVLADYYQQLITTGTINDRQPSGKPGSKSQPKSSVSSRAKTGAKSGSTTPTVSARAVANAKADVLRATQTSDAAQSALNNADLVAPVAGTVGALTLSRGSSASDGQVTIVGHGTAVVSFEAPLVTRTLLSKGMSAAVSPAGSLTSLPGKIDSIAVLETDGTAGDSPTYSVTVVVDDPGLLLSQGARAGVEVTTRTSSGVVTVPVSAVTPTGVGAGTIQVVDSASDETPTTIDVATGAVGGGRVEIIKGLNPGQLVVLSDRTLPLPTEDLMSGGSRRAMGR